MRKIRGAKVSFLGQSEPTAHHHDGMDGAWTRNTFPLGYSYLANPEPLDQFLSLLPT
jgi:hypothetical protein